MLDLRAFVEQHVAPALLSVKGVADVNIFGGEQKQLNIILNKDKLIEYSIPIDLVIKNLKNANLKIFGSLVTSNQEIQVIQDNFISLKKIKSINIINKSGRIIKLSDVATIEFNASREISKATIEGRPGVIVMVIGQLNADTVAVTEALDEAFIGLRKLTLKK